MIPAKTLKCSPTTSKGNHSSVDLIPNVEKTLLILFTQSLQLRGRGVIRCCCVSLIVKHDTS